MKKIVNNEIKKVSRTADDTKDTIGGLLYVHIRTYVRRYVRTYMQ